MFSDITRTVIYGASGAVGVVVVFSVIFGTIYGIRGRKAQRDETVAADDSPAGNDAEAPDDDEAPLVGNSKSKDIY